MSSSRVARDETLIRHGIALPATLPAEPGFAAVAATTSRCVGFVRDDGIDEPVRRRSLSPRQRERRESAGTRTRAPTRPVVSAVPPNTSAAPAIIRAPTGSSRTR